MSAINSTFGLFQNLPLEISTDILNNIISNDEYNEFEAHNLAKTSISRSPAKIDDAFNLAITSKGMFEITIQIQRKYELKRLYDFKAFVIEKLDQEKYTGQITCLNGLAFRLPEDVPNFVRLRQLVDICLESIVDELKTVDLKKLDNLEALINTHASVKNGQLLYPFRFYNVFRDALVCNGVRNQDKKWDGCHSKADCMKSDYSVIDKNLILELVKRIIKRHPIERLINIATHFLDENNKEAVINAYLRQDQEEYEVGALDKLFDFALTFSDRKYVELLFSKAYAKIDKQNTAREVASFIPEAAIREKPLASIDKIVSTRGVYKKESPDEMIKPKKSYSDIGVRFFLPGKF